MIVFVENQKDLRFTNGPLRVEGRLDVGLKVDSRIIRRCFGFMMLSLRGLRVKKETVQHKGLTGIVVFIILKNTLQMVSPK
jgi:hypothetical protein